MRFAILRSGQDAMDEHISSLKGHAIDPMLGPHGGFVLETVELGERPPSARLPARRLLPQGMLQDTVRDPVTGKTAIITRLVIETRTLQDTVRDEHGKEQPARVIVHHICPAREEDARALASHRPGWLYMACDDDRILETIRGMKAPTSPQPMAPGTLSGAVPPQILQRVDQQQMQHTARETALAQAAPPRDEPAEPVQPKRKRGRPRKDPVPVEVEARE